MRALVLLALLAGCSDGADHAATAPAPRPGAEQPTEGNTAPRHSEPEPSLASNDVAAHMSAHVTHANAVREAIVQGKLASAQRHAERLANHAAPKHFPTAWLVEAADYQLFAADLARADGLAEAGAAAAQLARACGECHTARKFIPAVEAPPAPPAGHSHLQYMRRHKWAADQMWLALVQPSEQLWDQAVAALADAPVNFTELSHYGDNADTIVELGLRVHELATRGKSATDSRARAVVLGEFLATCAHCHELTGGGRPSPPADTQPP